MATRFGLTLALVSALAGCGQPSGALHGKITYAGKPVALGSIVLVHEPTLTHLQEPIGMDGSYRFGNVPPGTYRIGIFSPDPARPGDFKRPAGGDDKRKPPKSPPPRPGTDKWFPIPERYADWRRSGLVATVAGDTPLDIKLED